MNDYKFAGKHVIVLWVAVAVLGLTSPAARAAGTITITKAVAVEKDAPNLEVTSGYADADLSVDFRGDADCSCVCAPRLTFTWHFGDTTSTRAQNTSHVYGTLGAGNRGPWLHVECPCGAVANSNAIFLSAIDDIRVDRIGDIVNPTNNGRLCFNSELRVAGTALPAGVNGSDKIDWHVLVVAVNVDLPNTASGSLPNLAAGNWPTVNSAWGADTLYISIDGPHVPGQQNELKLTGTPSFVYNNKSVKKFYDGGNDHSENPGPNPNWFYYYTQTSANDRTLYYDADGPINIRWEGGQWRAYLADDTSPYTPPEGDNAGTNLTYIDAFAWTARHENRHVTTSTNWYPTGYNGAIDGDSDWIPNNLEAALGGTPLNPINGGPFDPTKTNTDGDWTGRDDEDYTCHTQSAWAKGSADTEDWAHPGNQWQ